MANGRRVGGREPDALPSSNGAPTPLLQPAGWPSARQSGTCGTLLVSSFASLARPQTFQEVEHEVLVSQGRRQALTLWIWDVKKDSKGR